MQTEYTVLLLYALLTALAVVGKTRAGTSATLAKPTLVGWATIVIAVLLLLFSSEKAREDARQMDALRQDLSCSMDRNLLFLTSFDRSPKRIEIEIPVRVQPNVVKPFRNFDIRDLLYPGWEHETNKRGLGSLRIGSPSRAFSAGLSFFVGFDEMVSLETPLDVTKRILLRSSHEQPCPVKRILSSVPATERSFLDKWLEESVLDKDVPTDVIGAAILDDALRRVAYRRGFFDLSCFGRLPIGWRGSTSSLPFQDEVRLNRLAIQQALGIIDLGRRTCGNGTGRSGFSGRDDGKSRLDEVVCAITGVDETESRSLKLSFVFDGTHSLADWLPDFRLGTRVLNISYYDHNETALSRRAIAGVWSGVFVDEVATITLPANTSRSVALRYEARPQIQSTADQLNLSWLISSVDEIVQVSP